MAGTGEMDMTVIIILLIIHMACVLLTWLGIRSGALNVKKYLLPMVLFVPFWGILCVLILHFQIGMDGDGVKEVGVEKMRVDQEVYRNIFVDQEGGAKDIVPLEEALIVNKPALRRNLIMDVLNDDPEEYLEFLQQARMNDDPEVVHYAATAMSELSKEHEFRLQKMERAYSANPEDGRMLDEYCGFLKEYIGCGLVQGQMERMQRQQYCQLLTKKLEREPDPDAWAELVENQLDLGEYARAEASLGQMGEKWPRREEYWLLKLRFYAEQGEGRELARLLRQIDGQHIYLSAKARETLAFWRRDDLTGKSGGER